MSEKATMAEAVDPLNNYDKRHLPGCRKLMYDPKSSPCTCLLEYERVTVQLAALERNYQDAKRSAVERALVELKRRIIAIPKEYRTVDVEGFTVRQCWVRYLPVVCHLNNIASEVAADCETAKSAWSPDADCESQT